MESYIFHRGDGSAEQRDMDGSTSLANVRAALGDYINGNFRFVDCQGAHPAYADAIVSTSSEGFEPLSAITPLNNNVYMTDVTRVRNVDLVGVTTDFFADRDMHCSVVLNEEPAAQPLNQGKMRPILLNYVKTTNPNVGGFGDMANVVICQRDSIIQFNLTAWAGAGYAYTITTSAGTPVTCDSLLILSTVCSPDNYMGTALMRYFSRDPRIDGKLIQAEPVSSINLINGTPLQYMKFTIKVWRLTQWVSTAGQVYQCGLLPPHQQHLLDLATAALRQRFSGISRIQALAAGTGLTSLIPGGGISAGSTVPANQQSGQAWGGGLASCVPDNSPQGVIGEVTFYMFVFSSASDAAGVVASLNGPW